MQTQKHKHSFNLTPLIPWFTTTILTELPWSIFIFHFADADCMNELICE